MARVRRVNARQGHVSVMESDVEMNVRVRRLAQDNRRAENKKKKKKECIFCY